MNPEKVSEHLPLIKMEIIQDVEDKGHLILYSCKTVEAAKQREYKARFVQSFDTFEQAFQGALFIYLGANFDIKGKQKNIECKAKHQVTLTEFVRGRDGGSEWADPENDIIKTGRTEINIFCGEERHQFYDDGFNPSNPMFAISNAYVKYMKLMEAYLPTPKEIEEIVGFTWRDMVFNEPHFMQDQLAVAGTNIDGKYKDAYDQRLKVSYFEDYVSYHKRNEAYLIENSVYINGQRVLEVKTELPSDSPEIIKQVASWIKQNHPEVYWFDYGSGGESLTEEGESKLDREFTPSP